MTHRVTIIGGGIAGLAAAHRIAELAKENPSVSKVTLLEATERLGGSIATERVGDFLVEAGPDSFITEKPWALRLCERLGLTPDWFQPRPNIRKFISSIRANSNHYPKVSSYSRPLAWGRLFEPRYFPGAVNCAWQANCLFRAVIER